MVSSALATYAESDANAAQRIGQGDDRVAVVLQPLDDAVPAGCVGPATVNEHNCRLSTAGMRQRGLGGDASTREDAHGTCGHRGRG